MFWAVIIVFQTTTASATAGGNDTAAKTDEPAKAGGNDTSRAAKKRSSKVSEKHSALDSKKDYDYAADYGKIDDLKHGLLTGVRGECLGGPWKLQKLTQLMGMRVRMWSIWMV